MKITNHISNFFSNKKTILTIGTFDGVHLGHREILDYLVKISKKENNTSILLTFFPHPRMVLQKDNNLKLINTIEEKQELLHKLGVDELVIHPFDKEFSRLSAFEFVRDILVEKFNISKIIIGYDHHFGKNREGNFEQLQEYGQMFGFEVEEITAKTLNDIAISSTKIRRAIENGDILKANKYLGYNFMLSGKIVKGNNLGSKIGFPTANISVSETYKLIPKTGSYLVKSNIENIEYFGMMNIGFRPTVKGDKQTIEVHYFDFDKDIYDEVVEVEVLEFLRDEQKFDSIETLKDQLKKDEIFSKSLIFKKYL